MEPINRRAFITRSGAVAAAAGAAVLVPSQLVGAVTKAANASAKRSGQAPFVALETAEPGEPIIAHILNLSSGEIAIFSGSREVTLHDRELAQRLAQASGGK